MKPILFNAEEKVFNTYGLGEINAISAVVTRERNGNYSLYMEYPINGEMANVLQKEMKIKADAGVRTKNQTFEITRIIKDTSSRKIKIHAKHISHKTEHIAVKPNINVNGDASVALLTWKNNLIGDFDFDVWSNITTVNKTQWNVQNIQNARQALGGASGSILDVWGGEYEFDNTMIKLHKELGRKTPTVLEYGRNILSAETDIDIESTYTAIYPYAVYTVQDSDEERIVTLPELIIESELTNNFANKRVTTIDLSSSFKEDETPTEDKLRKLAQRYVKNNRVGEPKIKTKISYIDLSTTLDYADMKIMEEVELCDRLPIYYPSIGITSDNAKVNTIEYDVLLERNISIEIGAVGTSLRSAIANDVNTRLDHIESNIKKQSQLPPYLINDRGNRIWFSTPDPNMEHKVDDIWFDQNGKYERTYRWNGEMWVKISDTETDALELQLKFQQINQQTDQLNQSIVESERKANEALESVGLNTNLANEAKRIAGEVQTSLDITNKQLVTDRQTAQDTLRKADEALLKAGETQTSLKTIQDEVNRLGVTFEEYERTTDTLSGKVANYEALIDRYRVSLESTQSSIDILNTFKSVTERTSKQLIDRLTALDGSNGKINEILRDADSIRQSLSAKTELSTVQNLINISAEGIRTQLSRVEQKIPTDIRTVNLLRDSELNKLPSTNYWKYHEGLRVEDGWIVYDGKIGDTKFISQSILEQIQDDPIDTVYTAVVDLNVSNYSEGTTNPYNFLYLSGYKKDGKWMSAQYIKQDNFKIFNNQGNCQAVIQFKIPIERSQIRDFNFYIHLRDAEGKFKFRRVRLVRGNMISDWSPAPEDNVSKTEFQTINEKVNFYERLIGTSSNDGTAKTNLARMVMTDSLYQTEVLRQETNVDILARVSDGVSVLDDPTFDSGLNRLLVYDNSNSGNITFDRQTNVGSSQPNGKPNRLKVSHTGTASPHFGGICYQPHFSLNQNSVFVVDFVALLPAGRSFNLHNNSLGTGGSVRWVTSNEGTGTWRRYVAVYTLGTGSIHPRAFAFIAVKDGTVPTIDNPLVWYIQSFDIKNITQSGSHVLSTKVTQLAESWAVKTLNHNGDILAQLNQTNGLTKIQNKLIYLDGTVSMNDAFIKKLLVDTATVNTLTAFAGRFGSIIASRIDASKITVGRGEFLQAGFTAMNSRGTLNGQRFRIDSSDGGFVEMNAWPEFRSQDSKGVGVVLGNGRAHFLNSQGSRGYIGVDLTDPTQTNFGIFLSNGVGSFTFNIPGPNSYSTDDTYYTVRSGDTLNGIASRYGTTSTELARINGISNPDLILPGDRLLIRRGTTYYTSGKLVKGLELGLSSQGDFRFYTRVPLRVEKGLTVDGGDLWVKSGNRLVNDSDRRMKHDIQETQITALDHIKALTFKAFKWNHNGQFVPIGLIAQDSGILCTETQDGYFGIDHNVLTNLTTKGVQELYSYYESLEKRIEELERKVA